MIALFAKKKTGAVAARPVEEPLLVAAVHDARRGAAVSTAALARGGWCEDVSGLTNAQVLEQDQSRRGRWSAAFRTSRQRGLMRGSALAPPLVAVAVPVPMAVTVPVPVGRGSVLAPQPPSMRPQPSMTAPVVVELNSFGRWAGRHHENHAVRLQADGMILSDPGRSARPAADGGGCAMASRRTDKRSMRLYYDATEEDAISAARAR